MMNRKMAGAREGKRMGGCVAMRGNKGRLVSKDGEKKIGGWNGMEWKKSAEDDVREEVEEEGR